MSPLMSFKFNFSNESLNNRKVDFIRLRQVSLLCGFDFILSDCEGGLFRHREGRSDLPAGLTLRHREARSDLLFIVIASAVKEISLLAVLKASK